MRNSEFSMKTIKVLSSDLKIAEQMVTNMAQKHVRERIAEVLLLLKDFFGLEEDNITINTVLTREDIANMAGTTTETTIRVLSDFNKSKIIKLIGKNKNSEYRGACKTCKRCRVISYLVSCVYDSSHCLIFF